MGISVSQFNNDLYDEHIEEAAFLFELVASSLQESEFSWNEAIEFESRREAHIDALSIGGEVALKRCVELAENGAGELYVYVSVILRQEKEAEFAARMTALVLVDAANLLALSCALAEHATDSQLVYLSTQNIESNCSVTLIAIRRAIGHIKGIVLLEALDQALHGRLDMLLAAKSQEDKTIDEDMLAEQIGLFGLIAEGSFRAAHLVAVGSENEQIRRESTINLHCLALDVGKNPALQSDGSAAGVKAAIMIGAGPGYARSLLSNLQSGVSEDILQALALSGLPEVARPLVSLLDSDFAETVAVALFYITGAELFEVVFEEEEIDEGELFEEEQAEYELGNKPKRPDGEAYGEERTRVAVDPERWKQWLKANRDKFNAGARYRLGELITPDSLVRVLSKDNIPEWGRFYTEHELRCRYRMTEPFDISLNVRQQRQQLAAMQQSLSDSQKFVPGKWYVDGQLLTGVE
ncbi:MAG: hypothetical protein AB8B79_00695 [Granulosicoccus sp.]